MTERQIIDGCKNGDASARRELYERYAGLMYGICCRYTPDRVMAEDLLHDGFITLYTKIGEFRGEGSFEGWCRRIFVTTALGYLRKRNLLANAADVTEIRSLKGPSPTALESIEAGELMEAISELPDGYRTVLNLFAIEGYSHREIAEALGINENTSRSQFSRARVKLAEILREKGFYVDE